MSASSKTRRKETRAKRPGGGVRPLKDRPRSARAAAAPAPIDHSQARGFYSQLGFHSVRMAATDGRMPVGGGGDLHLRYNRDQLANQAREFSRDNGLFQGIIDKAASYIIGTGLQLQVKTSSKEWNRAAETWWKEEFWQWPEVSGILTGFQVEELVIKELLSMGDTGVMKTRLKKLQLIESEQIRGKDLKSDGLRRDSNGVVTGFWVCPYSEFGQLEYSNAREIEKDDFMFMLRPDRPSSKRAVPTLQAAFSMFHRINDVCDSEAQAWQMLARLAIIVNKKDAGLTGLQTSEEDESKQGDDEPHVTTRVQDWSGGTSFWGEPDEDIRGVERNIPGANFPQSLTMFLRLLGIPLGMPLELVALDWTKSNYSQTRAVLQQAYQAFIRWQALLKCGFYRPTWKWALDIAIRDGILKPPPKAEELYKHDWIAPTFPWIDQLQEAKAYGEMVDRGYATHAQVLKSRDIDRDDWLETRMAEFRSAMEAKKKLEAEFPGTTVPLEHFVGLSYSVNHAAQEKAKAAEEKAKKDDGGEEEEDGERAAAPVPPINIAVKVEGPTETETRVVEEGGKGQAKRILQKHTYGDKKPKGEVA